MFFKAPSNRAFAAAVMMAVVLLASEAQASELTVCFIPGEDCTAMLVREIDSAKSELLVQAYNFTSPPIIAAIGRAPERGVKVKVILDRVNEQHRYTESRYSAGTYLCRQASAVLPRRN